MKLNLGRALDVTLKTTPYMVRRSLAYGVVLAAAVVYIIALATVARVFGQGAFWVLFAVSVAAAPWVRYRTPLFTYGPLHEVHIGHLALLSNWVVEDEGPMGPSQMRWASDRLRERFRDALEMAEVDAFVQKAVTYANEARFGSPFLPPQMSMKTVHDAIMARVVQNDGQNVWATAAEGVALYAKSARLFVQPILITESLKLAASAAALLAFMVPLGLIAVLTPHEWLLFRFGLCYVAVLLAWGAKGILLEPLASAAMLVLYHQETDGQEITPELVAEFEKENPAYREMIARAKIGAAQ